MNRKEFENLTKSQLIDILMNISTRLDDLTPSPQTPQGNQQPRPTKPKECQMVQVYDALVLPPLQ